LLLNVVIIGLDESISSRFDERNLVSLLRFPKVVGKLEGLEISLLSLLMLENVLLQRTFMRSLSYFTLLDEVVLVSQDFSSLKGNLIIDLVLLLNSIALLVLKLILECFAFQFVCGSKSLDSSIFLLCFLEISLEVAEKTSRADLDVLDINTLEVQAPLLHHGSKLTLDLSNEDLTVLDDVV